MEDGWTIRDYREGDEQGILDLLVASFGRWPPTDIRVPAIDHLRWKLAGGRGGPQYVVDCAGKIVGFRTLASPRWRFQGRVLKGTRLGDLAIHPDYHSRGVMKALWELTLTSANESYDVNVAISRHPWVQSYMRQSRMYEAANTIEWLELDIRPLARGRACGVEVAAVSGFDGRFDDLVRLASEPFDFTLERDRDYLTWRYADERAGRVMIFEGEENGELAGYAVLALSRGKAFLADLLTLPGKNRALTALVEHAALQAAAEGMGELRCWCPAVHPYRDRLFGLGFVPKRPVEGLLIGPLRTTDLGPLFTDERFPIHITIGDTDIV